MRWCHTPVPTVSDVKLLTTNHIVYAAVKERNTLTLVPADPQQELVKCYEPDAYLMPFA